MLICPVSLLCLLSAADAWPRRTGWWRRKKKDAPCCDFCRPVSFLLPLLLFDLIMSSSDFFSVTSPPCGCTAVENKNTAKISKGKKCMNKKLAWLLVFSLLYCCTHGCIFTLCRAVSIGSCYRFALEMALLITLSLGVS